MSHKVNQFFELLEYRVNSKYVYDPDKGLVGTCEAAVKVQVGGQIRHEVAEGNGLINAMDQALRNALLPVYPCLEEVQIHHYQVNKVTNERSSASLATITMQIVSNHASCRPSHTSSDVVHSTIQVLAEGFRHVITRAPSLVSA